MPSTSAISICARNVSKPRATLAPDHPPARHQITPRSIAYAPTTRARRHALAAARLSGNADTYSHTILAARIAPRLLWARPKNKPRKSGAKSKGGNAPFQGHLQNIRVGCACHGQLQLAPACDFWDTVFETTFHRRTFCCRNGVLVRAAQR